MNNYLLFIIHCSLKIFIFFELLMSGGIVPKKKRSQNKKRVRHSTWQTEKIKYWDNKINLVKNKETGKVTLAHRVDPETGYYGDKQIITARSKNNEKIVDA